MTAADADRYARAALSRVIEPGDPAVLRRVDRDGAAATWAAVRERHPQVDPGRDLDRLAALGGRLVCPGDDEWPAGLQDLGAESGGRDDGGPPIALWVRGSRPLPEATARAVAIVGARASTPYGGRVAQRLAGGLADRGWCVVSGAAFGIDGEAHRGALAAGGPTVAILAGGIDVPYPSGHAVLLAQIAEHGWVVSEAPPGERPLRRRFLTRNRLIAAMSAGTVVVEATLRSGALNTARHARRLGRPVMAVPGPVSSPLSAGCHQLLREHRETTALVTGAAEIVEEAGGIGELTDPARGAVGPRDHLSAAVRRLLDAVPARVPQGPAVLAQRSGLALPAVLAVLGPLVTEGLVVQEDGGYRLTALGRAPSNPGAPPNPAARSDPGAPPGDGP